ncbi:MAG: hypothetical protein IKE41_03475 [Clostridia bacterium]|nr:hypothetical protein [Clostridia bacterium]
MSKNIKKIISYILVVCTAVSLSFAGAMKRGREPLKANDGGCFEKKREERLSKKVGKSFSLCKNQILEILDVYRYYVDSYGKPRILIIGSGRGMLRFGDKVFAMRYDHSAYGDKKYDYFLVDFCRELEPDYICDATVSDDMDLLGRGSWDKCVLEFLPHSVSMGGALKNAMRLVKHGGKVYINGTNFFHPVYDSADADECFPQAFKDFKIDLARFEGLSIELPIKWPLKLPPERPDFCQALIKSPLLTRNFFESVYGLNDEEIASIKLVPKSSESWPAKAAHMPEFYVWEITKA